MNKTVTVLATEEYDNDWPPENLVEFIKWASNLLAQIPEEYKNKAMIEIDTRSGYDDDRSAAIEVVYVRPLTDIELAAARLQESQRLAAEEAKAKEMYDRLKARFG